MPSTPPAISALDMEPTAVTLSPSPQLSSSESWPTSSPPPPIPAQRTRSDGPRRTSHYSQFQTRCSPSNDLPPSYSTSQHGARLTGVREHVQDGCESLPPYSCSVLKQGVMYMRIERLSPFQALPKQDWRSVYVVLRGTQLCLYKIKSSTTGSKLLAGPGKFLRRYTLQHGEVGLANDVNDHVLTPASRIAHLIPAMARQRAYEKDPALFNPVKQFAIRLRLESDQLLLADTRETSISEWLEATCAGIDIAFDLDERHLPRQCTVPRRQRTHRPEATDPATNLQDAQFIQEQERILREMYPALARDDDSNRGLERVETIDPASNGNPDLSLTTTMTNEQEGEDIDISAMAEDSAVLQASLSRPTTTRQTTASSAESFGPSPTADSNNFDETGKWAPPHPYSARAQFRYIRRCMPVLLFDTPRATSIVMCNGRRLHINHKMDMLEEWELQPPSYDAHEFPVSDASPLERVPTQASTAGTAYSARSGVETPEIQVVQAAPESHSQVTENNTMAATTTTTTTTTAVSEKLWTRARAVSDNPKIRHFIVLKRKTKQQQQSLRVPDSGTDPKKSDVRSEHVEIATPAVVVDSRSQTVLGF